MYGAGLDQYSQCVPIIPAYISAVCPSHVLGPPRLVFSVDLDVGGYVFAYGKLYPLDTSRLNDCGSNQFPWAMACRGPNAPEIS